MRNNGLAAIPSEKTDTTCCFARLLHCAVRKVRKDRHDHVHRTTDVAVPSRRQKRQTRKTSVPPTGIRFLCRQKRQTRKSMKEGPIPNAEQNCSWPFGTPMLLASCRFNAFGWDSLICQILPLNSFSVALRSLSW